MKAKIAKRQASDYESSLSSHDSCFDSIMTQFEKSSYKASSCGSKGIMVIHDCQTPSKNAVNYYEKSYSLKKLETCTENKWDEEDENGEKGDHLWLTESEDSKIRKKQPHYSQLQKINYKQHAKVLRFEDERIKQKLDKQNQPMIINTNIPSSGDENDEFYEIKQIRKKDKRRKVFRTLYDFQKQGFNFYQIKEQ